MSYNTNSVHIIGQNKITLTVVPGGTAETFSVEIDTRNFAYGIPMAIGVLIQATQALLPAAYDAITALARQHE